MMMSGFITNDEDVPNEVDDDDESVHTIHGYNVDSPARQQSYDRESSVAPQTSSPPRFYGIDLAEDSNDDNDDDSGDENTTITISHTDK